MITPFEPGLGPTRGGRSYVALEANLYGKMSEESCYGSVRGRWSVVAGEQRIRFDCSDRRYTDT
jgi:hypothetical protein